RVLPFSTRDVFLAVSPSGHLAVAGSEPAPSDGCPRYRERVRVAELDPSGTLLWNSILGSETCPGSMDVAGLGYSGEGVVLGGSAEGKVNVGAGAPVDVGSEPSGYVVKLRPRR
ncbi:MAG TPA: hypothetical protein VK420_16670, partial [Longimicrobium sp.]|nr:hypothetical protein [Longimicrobium sp.]